MECINPTTELKTLVEETPDSLIPDLYNICRSNSRKLGLTSIDERQAIVRQIGNQLESRLDEIARTISSEMGKPFNLAQRELSRTIEEIRFTEQQMIGWLSPEPCPGGTVHYEPIGVTAVISPWNFPIMLPLRGIVPAIACGNGVIFKPSELTPNCGLILSEIIKAAMCDYKDAFQVAIGGKELGRAVVKQPIDLIAFTGSTQVGKWIASEASKTLKRCLLELGGLDPAIVLEDSDIDKICEPIVRANATNSGQVCNALKRVFVPSSCYERFIAKAAEVSKALTIGDPLDSPDMGPLVSEVQLNRVLAFIEDAKQLGARVISGGTRPDRKGYFLYHTVLADLPAQTRCLHEEPFGPILPVIAYKDLNQAIELANATPFGLTASVWGNDTDRCLSVAKELVAGTVSINSHAAGGPGAPWGGAKESGIGRMKTREGFHEFTNIKLIR